MKKLLLVVLVIFAFGFRSNLGAVSYLVNEMNKPYFIVLTQPIEDGSGSLNLGVVKVGIKNKVEIKEEWLNQISQNHGGSFIIKVGGVSSNFVTVKTSSSKDTLYTVEGSIDIYIKFGFENLSSWSNEKITSTFVTKK